MWSTRSFDPPSRFVGVPEDIPYTANFYSGPSAVTRKEKPTDKPPPKPRETLQSLVEFAHNSRPTYKKVRWASAGDLVAMIPLPSPKLDPQGYASDTEVEHNPLPSPRSPKDAPAPKGILKTSPLHKKFLDLSPPTSRGKPNNRCEITTLPSDRNPAATRTVIRIMDSLTNLTSHHVCTVKFITTATKSLYGPKANCFNLPSSIDTLIKSASGLRA